MRPFSWYAVFGVLCAGSLLIGGNALLTTFALARNNDAYTHILLILPISIALLLMQWSSRKCKPDPSVRLGASLLALAVLIAVAGLRGERAGTSTNDTRLFLEMLAVVLWWMGSFLFCFGGQAFRACIFSLLFLLWLVPIPAVALNYLVSYLQQGSALTARELFTLAGIPVAQIGTVLRIPGGLSVEVTQECSSIRSSMMLAVISVVMSHLLVRSYWGRAAVMLAAVPLSVVKNGLRVFTLAVLGAYVDPGVVDSPLHHQGGVVFLALSVAGVLALIWAVNWIERRRSYQPGRKISSMVVGAGGQTI